MRPRRNTLKLRLLLSHLAVVFAGVVVFAITSRLLADTFFADHVRDMNQMMGGGMMGSSGTDLTPSLEEGFADSISRALLFAGAAGGVVAVIAALIAAGRIVAPIEAVRVAARRMARGSYSERVPISDLEELAALADDVNRLGETLSATEQRRVRLMSDIAHELRTPVATIEGYMEGLLDGVFEPSDRIFAATAGEAQRLHRYISELGELSRTEEGAVEMAIADLDAREVVSDVTALLQPAADSAGVRLELSGRQDGFSVRADPERFRQILTNVIGNAVKYTPEGGQVRVTLSRSGSMVRIGVTDTGRGFRPPDAERLFERFYRAEPDGPPGTGIGLTIARSLARMQGGDITATSPGPGRGSTFTVTVPAV